jgi:hypothetical protein
VIIRIAARTWQDLPDLTVGGTVGAGEPVDLPAGFEGQIRSIGPSTKSWDPDQLRSFIEFVVDVVTPTPHDVAMLAIGAWLSKRLESRRGTERSLTIDGETVDPDDPVAVERAVRAHLYPDDPRR